MKKKFLLTLLCAGTLCGGLTLSAWSCGTDTPNKPDQTEHEHSYVQTVIEPTCQDKGYTLYKCECSEEYKDNYTEVVDHNYKDGKCIWCGSENLKPTEGLEFTLSDDGTYYSVTGIGTVTDTDIVIPSTYNEKPVTAIGESAFVVFNDGTPIKNTNITSVVIPDSIISIDDGAFGLCTALTSITIPDSVVYIGDGAFAVCTALTILKIGNGVTTIGYAAFNNCIGLTSIILPNSVTSIGDAAFYYCSGLTNITIPDSVTSIGDDTFDGCSKLTSLIFNGTKAQWQAIKKNVQHWSMSDYVVHCTDGDISKSDE
ncbi:MAG: leucine-rich repeat domain-containing protein [Clostridia bacterium]|nr:leucine-rich repeat domain-containing protein [Clostridia bacterium]